MLPPLARTLARSAALTAVLAAYAAMAWRFWFSADAAWVDARYSRHLAQGLGPVFNPHEAPVEAFSSVGIVLLGAVAEASGLRAVPALQLVALGCGALLLAALYGFLRDQGVRSWLALGAVGSLALTPTLGAWTSGLPGAVPGVLAIFWLFDRLVRGRGSSGAVQGVLAAILVVLLRQDGVLWALAAVGLVGLWHQRKQRALDLPLPSTARPRRGPWWPVVAASGVAVLGAAGALTGWRVLTFGDPVPWYLRTGLPLVPLDGLRTLVGATIGLGLPLMWLGLGAWSALRRHRDGPVLGLLALGVLAVLLGGTDPEPFGRGLLPLAVFGTVVVARVANDEWSTGHRGTALGLVAAATLLAVVPAFDVPLAPRRVRQAADLRPDTARTRTEISHWRFTRRNTLEALRLGREVRRVVAPSSRWTAGTPGARGYASHLEMIDLSGRTNPVAWARRVGDRAPRVAMEDAGPTLLRARIVDDAGVARVLVADWDAADPDYDARRVDLGSDGWLVLQERGEDGVTPPP